jgi:putative membrane protein
MQVLLISGIGFAIVAVLFALQNNVPITVSFFAWSFGGSLALVLLITLGIGAIVAGLLSSPRLLRSQWAGSRLRRQVATLEEQNQRLQKRVDELDGQLESLLAAQALEALPMADNPGAAPSVRLANPATDSRQS